MGLKINHKILIPAILLFLPLVLILIFDPAAWKSAANLISDILGTIFFIDLPIGMCLWHWFKPEHFRGNRYMISFGLMTFFCWAVVAGGMFIACRTGHTPENGFSIVCAYALGWMYIWFTMVPIGTVYVIFRVVLKLIRDRKFPDTSKKSFRNILLALIPFGILLVCHGLSDILGFHWTARILFLFLYPVSGIVLLILFTKTYIFNRPWGKLKKVFFFLLTLFFWFHYMVFPPSAYALTMRCHKMQREDIFYSKKSQNPKIEAFCFNDNEFRNQCFAVHIKSSDAEVPGSPVFHTRASVFQKIRCHWEGTAHFVFDSSDIGVIHIRYQNGKWIAEPKELLIQEGKDHAE